MQIGSKWFIDLTPLRRKPPITFRNQDGDTFKVSLCGSVRECNGEAGCKLGGNRIDLIGTRQNSKVLFDISQNEVMVSSSTVGKVIGLDCCIIECFHIIFQKCTVIILISCFLP